MLMEDIAYDLAQKAHQGQYYGTQDYFEAHVQNVVNKLFTVVKCDDEESVTVALLHDIVEDTDITLSDLAFIYGFSSNVVEAVDAITKRKNETRKEYIDLCKSNNIAHKVKIADTLANLEASVRSYNAWRVEKYSNQLIELYKE